MTTVRMRPVAAALVSAAILGSASPLRAACNLIPGTAKTLQRASLGATNRPVRRRRASGSSCGSAPATSARPGFLPSGARPRRDARVQGARRHQPRRRARQRLRRRRHRDVRAARRRHLGDVLPAPRRPRDAHRRRPRRSPPRLPVPRHRRRFVAPDGDDLTLAGPVAIARHAEGATRCRAARDRDRAPAQTGPPRLRRRALRERRRLRHDGPERRRSRSFTALPPPNDYAADCFQESPPCTATATEVRATLDARRQPAHADRAGAASSTRDAGPAGAAPDPHAASTSPLPFQVPDQVFLGSFTPEGGLLPPILEPQLDPTVADPDVFTLFGSVDAPVHDDPHRAPPRHLRRRRRRRRALRDATSTATAAPAQTLVRRRSRDALPDRRRVHDRRVRRRSST